MFQLIVAVISIALVAALAIAAVYYGGSAFSGSREKSVAMTIASHSSQIKAAFLLHKLENGASASSLDELVTGADSPLADTLGEADAELDKVEYRQTLAPLLDELPARERTILLLRFFGNCTQTQIADRLGISQMHVSRLLSQTLAKLREGLLKD